MHTKSGSNQNSHSANFNLVSNIIISVAAGFVIASSSNGIASENTWQTYMSEGQKALDQQSLAKAELFFKQALAAIKSSAHTTEDTANCLSKLANTLTLENKTEEAEDVYKHLLSLLEQKYGKDNPKLVETYFSLGSIYESEGDETSAMRLYNKALAINEKNFGPYSPYVAQSLHHLGQAEYKAGQTEQAEENYKAAVSILEQQPSLGTSKYLEDLLGDYSDLLKKEDTTNQDLISDFEKEILKDKIYSGKPTTGTPASEWQKQMLIDRHNSDQWQKNEEEKVLLRGMETPFSNSELAPIYSTMSDVFYKQIHYGMSEPSYKRIIAIDIKSLGPNHPSVADDLTGLALLYITQHRYEEAEPLLTRALSIYEAAYGNDSMLTIKTRVTLGLVYDHLGKTNQSISSYHSALDQSHIVLGPNNLETAKLLNELAFLYFRQGKLEDACTFYQWALASTEGAVGSQSPYVAACLRDYAQVLQRLGRTAESDKLEARARDILIKADTTK